MNVRSVKPALVSGSPGATTLPDELDIVEGIIQAPIRMLVYGAEGIGKSTFAANAPDLVWLGLEAGTNHLKIRRIRQDRLRTFDGVMVQLRWLRQKPHPYRTLVIDPLGWLEALIFRTVCEQNNWRSVEQPGFGIGYAAALELWRSLLAEIEGLYDERQMNVIFVAHSDEKAKRSPDAESYDRYVVALNQRAAALLKQWCDYVFFVQRKVWTVKAENNRTTQARSDGTVVMHTQWSPLHDAKSRPGLPATLPFAYKAFIDARLQADPANNETQIASMRQRVAELLASLGDAKAANDTNAYIDEAPQDVSRLYEVVNVLTLELEKGRAA